RSCESWQERAKHLACEGDWCADSHDARSGSIGLAGSRFAETTYGANRFSRRFYQVSSFLSKRHSVGRSMKDLDAHFFLQPRDCPREAWRGDANAPCSFIDGT